MFLDAAVAELELRRRRRDREGRDQFDWFGPSGKAREKQRPPGWDWFVWLILAGRGFGKTRTGAEWVRREVKDYPYVNLIGATVDDARDIMIEGESGILAICPPDERPKYLSQKRQLLWPNGAKSLIFTADEPERLRGKQHMKVWADEVAAWRYEEAWDQLILGLRLGDNPQVCVTTTPKPRPLIRKLAKDPKVAVTRGSTYENEANLAAQFLAELKVKYEGTRLGRQELNAEILEDIEGALWSTGVIDAHRIDRPPQLDRIVVAVDPSGTDEEGNAEQGIVVAGRTRSEGYVLDDRSCRLSPNEWGRKAVQAYLDFRADALVFEKNFGGEMCRHVLETAARDMGVSANITEVWASRGKTARAEPIAALYEQGRVHHCREVHEPRTDTYRSPDLSRLENQMTTWVPGQPSPDRLDAAVWALTELDINAIPAIVRGVNPFSGYRG